MKDFFSELKRRNVIRAAGLYLVGAWLLTQVTSTVLPMFGAPDWLPRSIVILLAIGFVPALIFSWVFELTPQGLKRDEDVPAEQSIGPQTGRRMDRLIIVVLLLAVGYFAVDSARRVFDDFPDAIKLLNLVGRGGAASVGVVDAIIRVPVYLDVMQRRFTDAFQALDNEVANDERAHLQQLVGRVALRVLAGQTEAAKSAGEEARPLLEARLREENEIT